MWILILVVHSIKRGSEFSFINPLGTGSTAPPARPLPTSTALQPLNEVQPTPHDGGFPCLSPTPQDHCSRFAVYASAAMAPNPSSVSPRHWENPHFRTAGDRGANCSDMAVQSPRILNLSRFVFGNPRASVCQERGQATFRQRTGFIDAHTHTQALLPHGKCPLGPFPRLLPLPSSVDGSAPIALLCPAKIGFLMGFAKEY